MNFGSKHRHCWVILDTTSFKTILITYKKPWAMFQNSVFRSQIRVAKSEFGVLLRRLSPHSPNFGIEMLKFWHISRIRIVSYDPITTKKVRAMIQNHIHGLLELPYISNFQILLFFINLLFSVVLERVLVAFLDSFRSASTPPSRVRLVLVESQKCRKHR